MEPLIAIGACCVPLAAGAIGFLVWGNRDEKSDETAIDKAPPARNLSLAQRLRLRQRPDVSNRSLS